MTDDLHLKKTLELRNMIIVVRAVFHEDCENFLMKILPASFLVQMFV